MPQNEQVFDKCLLKNGRKKERRRGRYREVGRDEGKVKGRKEGTQCFWILEKNVKLARRKQKGTQYI